MTTIGDVTSAMRERGARLYRADRAGDPWVIDNGDGALWLVVADDNGWERRAPYAGRVSALTEVPGLHNAAGIGWIESQPEAAVRQ